MCASIFSSKDEPEDGGWIVRGAIAVENEGNLVLVFVGVRSRIECEKKSSVTRHNRLCVFILSSSPR